MHKRTPGDWTVATDHTECVIKPGNPITPIAFMSKASDIPTMRANARFIAAVPNMERVLDTINDGVEKERISMPAWLWNDVRAALVKARGDIKNREADSE